MFNIISHLENCKSKPQRGTSLVAQWLRIRLPMQGTRVRSLVQEDPTCHRATKPVHHNYWACALEPTNHNYWSPRAATTEARTPRARAPQREAIATRSLHTTTKSSSHSPQLEKAHAQQQRPNAAKKKKRKKTHSDIPLTPTRMVKNKKLESNKCWQGCGEIGMLIHC